MNIRKTINGNLIDWSIIDPLIKQHLPSMTYVGFSRKYDINPSVVSRRAKELGIKPAAKTISIEQRALISVDAKNRKVWRYDWSKYDDLIRIELPKMTFEQFRKQFNLEISVKAIAKRAKKLGIKQCKYHMTDETKHKMIESLRVETPELINKIKEIRDDYSLRKIIKELGIGYATLARIIKRYNINLSQDGIKRSREASRIASVGKIPWNKDGELSKETKTKISMVLIEQFKNGRKPYIMTNKAKKKWKRAYSRDGIYKFRKWQKSPAGQEAFMRMMAKMPITKSKISKTFINKILTGKFRPHGYVQGWYNSDKAGRVYYRSSYELRYYKQLDADVEVQFYIVEPFAIPYKFDNSEHGYVPDILVWYKNGAIEIIEIKPKRMIFVNMNKIKISVGQLFCSRMKYKYRIITEDDLV